MEENWAIEFCLQHRDEVFILHSDWEQWNEKVGVFVIVEDENCCGPTNNVLFAFKTKTERFMATADEIWVLMRSAERI